MCEFPVVIPWGNERVRPSSFLLATTETPTREAPDGVGVFDRTRIRKIVPGTGGVQELWRGCGGLFQSCEQQATSCFGMFRLPVALLLSLNPALMFTLASSSQF